MEQVQVYIILLCIIAVVGLIFQNSVFPIALLLVIAGIVCSFIPSFPRVTLSPDLVLNVFLPLLVYQISAFTSWRDVFKNLEPIVMLSIGHVIFITFLVAITIHYLIPEMGWPLACALGAIVSPPDDVAIVSIAEKIYLPKRIMTILRSEGLFNDATALILFRFSLAAVVTHQFNLMDAATTFLYVVAGETLWGLTLGVVLGEIRLRIKDPTLHLFFSFLTPFLAYLPAEKMGGSGVLATVVAGFIIGHFYLERFMPEVRTGGRAIWITIGFILQNFLFLLVGLNLRFTLENISLLSSATIFLYSFAIIAIVILGRFIWVWSTATIVRMLSLHRKGYLFMHWRGLFIISWSGLRGGISLAAVLSIPSLPLLSNDINPRDLMVFLVFSVIIATLLIQGVTLPWFLKKLGITKFGEKEKHHIDVDVVSAKLKMTKAVLRWLEDSSHICQENPELCDEIKLRIQEYKGFKNQLKSLIDKHKNVEVHDEEIELKNAVYLSVKIVEIERAELMKLWHEKKIHHEVKNRLLEQLDFKARNLTG